jgi:hypothetical protein
LMGICLNHLLCALSSSLEVPVHVAGITGS